MSLVIIEKMLLDHADSGRNCGSCAACCVLMAIVELAKPARWACDHLCATGCGRYETRPESCRAFHCLWLRGALAGDEALRPDALGVMFDYYRIAQTGEVRLTAHELWEGAFEADAARALLDELAQEHDIHLSYRDGRWSLRGRETTITPQVGGA